MGYDGYITIGTKIDTSGIDTGMSRINQTVKTQGAQLNNTMAKTFSLLKNTIIGVGIGAVLYGITKQLGDAVSRVDTLNNFSNVMGNLGVNSKDADQAIDYLSEKLTGLPTKLDDAALSVQKFTAINGNLKASTQMYLAVNNAILAGGASAQQQATAMYQLTDAYARGKPDVMDWRSMMAAMPAQLTQVAKVMGYGNADSLGQALRDGTVSMNEFLTTVTKMNTQSMGGFKSFQEQAVGATGGIQTAIANLKTAISRGLATIVDTIGQSNIAGFFNAISKAINKASLYVAAFVKLILTAINAVGALFGKKNLINMNKTKKNVGGATSSMNQLGSSADKASDNIGKATGNAKKLKKELKQLASFDEMNVLSDRSSSGSGGSGGSGGGGVSNLGDLSGVNFDLGETESKADKINAIFEKMKTTLGEVFGHVDFGPLADALINVYNAAKPLAELAWDNLKWIWFNVLVPLGKWTIEDFLPIWLNNVANGLKAVKPFLEVVSKVAKNLYTEVIKPLGQRVGRAIIDILEQMAPVLDAIGAWVRDHKPLIEDLFKVAINLNPLVMLLNLIEKITAGLEKLNDYLYENSDANKTVEGTQRRVNDLNRRLKSSQSDYTNAVKDARDAKKRLIEAEKESKSSGEELFNQIKMGKTDYANLTEAQQNTVDAYIDLQDAESKVKETEKKVKDTKDKLKDASLDHADAVLKETGNYQKYKEDVVKAYKEGRISAEDARNKIGVAMNNMSSDTKKKFTQDVPNDIKDGLDYNKHYKEKANTMKNNWKTKFIDKIDKKVLMAIVWPGGAILKQAFKSNVLDKLNNWAVVNIKTKKSGMGGRAKGGMFYPSRLPKLAVGGIVNMPGSGVPYNGAIIGERGAEAVVPLTDSQQMELLGQSIGRYITVNANINTILNGRVINRELQQLQNESNFASNR